MTTTIHCHRQLDKHLAWVMFADIVCLLQLHQFTVSGVVVFSSSADSSLRISLMQFQSTPASLGLPHKTQIKLQVCTLSFRAFLG